MKANKKQSEFRRIHSSVRRAIREELKSGGGVGFEPWRLKVVDAAKNYGWSTSIATAAYDCIVEQIKARLRSGNTRSKPVSLLEIYYSSNPEPLLESYYRSITRLSEAQAA